jgi:hypothetical protein
LAAFFTRPVAFFLLDRFALLSATELPLLVWTSQLLAFAAAAVRRPRFLTPLPLP